MYSLLKSFKTPDVSRHDRLVRSRIRLFEARDACNRYIESLREMRRTIYDSYQETKGLKMPWTRYSLMSGLIKEVLAAYRRVKDMKSSDDRNEILALHGVGDIADYDYSKDGHKTDDFSDEEGANDDELRSKELQSEIERLTIQTTTLQEVYRREAEVFETLAREYQSLQKYNKMQRYIVAKLIIKIAGKADL